MSKRFSIKTRVMFWYAFSLTVMTALVLFILIRAGERAVLDDAKTSLIISTDMAVNNVSVTDGRLILDDDFVYYMDSTWILVAREDGTVISGLEPEHFPDRIPFEADEIRRVGEGDEPFYVYDRLIESQSLGQTWIRGMTSASLADRDPAIGRMLLLLTVVLPILLILSLQGGWLITRRAFLPLKNLTDTVVRIQADGDLSQRVGSESHNENDEIHMAARAFDAMLERIEESFEREKQFTNDASHELRTPTAVIQAQSEYALANTDDPAEMAESLHVIHDQTVKMSALIDQLLLLARADRGAVKLHRENCDLSLLAEESAASHARYAQERGIRVTVRAPEGIYAHVDMPLMSRAIDNLMSNAIRYGREGGHVLVAVERGDQKALIRVRDDGIGIAASDLERIWDRFYRAAPAADSEGMGLGLPLVKWIAQAHGGSVSVTSLPNISTEFTISVPL